MKAQKITAIVAGLFFASSAFATPALQVDLSGGTYDTTNEDVVTAADSFFVYGLGTATGNLTETMILNDTFYLSIAITPRPTDSGATAPDIGSFMVGTTTYDETNLVYGTPPVVSNDLPTHGIYDTWYIELAFGFTTSAQSVEYNVQPTAGEANSGPGGPQECDDDAATTMPDCGTYWNGWQINVAGMTAPYELHFDLYHTSFKANPAPGAVSLDLKAPFSHDASTVPGTPPPPPPPPVKVPAPATLLLLGLGLAGMGAARRKQA